MHQYVAGRRLEASSDAYQGPLISRRQQESVAGFVDRARVSGAKVVCGGAVPGGALARGAYYGPTLVTGAPQRSEIGQDEVVGPVLVVLPFDSDDQGIELAKTRSPATQQPSHPEAQNEEHRNRTTTEERIR